MEDVFRALADPSRRLILDRLFERDGQALTELCGHLPQMTRFGVMSHLCVLEAAALVTSQKVGRVKRHYLNPVPIRLLHDRWTSKFAAPVVGAMVAIKQQLEGSNVSAPQNHVYVTYIRASTDQVWSAIVDGAHTERYYYGTRVESTWEVGAPVRYSEADGSVAVDGSLLAIEPGRSVTMHVQARWDPGLVAEGPVRMTWVLEPAGDGVTKLTVSYEGMGPLTAGQFVPGIAFIVAGLKSLLETGESLPVASGAP